MNVGSSLAVWSYSGECGLCFKMQAVAVAGVNQRRCGRGVTGPETLPAPDLNIGDILEHSTHSMHSVHSCVPVFFRDVVRSSAGVNWV